MGALSRLAGIERLFLRLIYWRVGTGGGGGGKRCWVRIDHKIVKKRETETAVTKYISIKKVKTMLK